MLYCGYSNGGGDTVTLDELLLNVNAVSFEDIVCQTAIQTEEDKEEYGSRGYSIQLTQSEFEEKFNGIDPTCIYYTPSVSMNCIYFNKTTLAVTPFHVDFFLAGVGRSTVEGAKRAIAQVEAEVAEHKYIGSVLALADGMRLEYFQKLIEVKGTDIPNLYELFFDFYTQSDYGFNNIDPTTLQAILNSKTPQEKEETANQLKDLPDTLIIYRGGNTNSTPYANAYSWTLDINIANFFAVRRGKGPGYIVTAEVDKKDIIEVLFDARSEQEVIVDPKNIRVIKETIIPGLDLLEEVLPIVAPMYHKYKDMMEELDFAQRSSIHGKAHEARVLLLCLILSHLLDLSMSDRKVLATAAIYHDTQRTHDWIEPEHGKASKEYYHDNVSSPDPLVELLVEYHCLPDEEAYQHIRNKRVLSKNRGRATKLFNIFKDADGLERIRLDGSLRELDLNQLRTEDAKTLSLVARICLEQVKI